MKQRLQDIRPFQPVVRHECLLAEVSFTVQAFVALNAKWLGFTQEESCFIVPPPRRFLVIPAEVVGAVWWLELSSTL